MQDATYPQILPERAAFHRLFGAVLQMLASVAIGAAVVLPLVLFDGYSQYWWLDEAAHLAAGIALALVVHLVVSRLTDSSRAAVLGTTGTVVVLQVGWEAVEWWVGLGAVLPAQTGVGAETVTFQTLRVAVGELYAWMLMGVQTGSDAIHTAIRGWFRQPARVFDVARTDAALLYRWLQHPKADDTMLDTLLAVNGAYGAAKGTELRSQDAKGASGDGATAPTSGT